MKFSVRLDGLGKISVTEALLDAFGVPIEDLFEAAKENFQLKIYRFEGMDVASNEYEGHPYYGAAGVFFDAYGWEEDMILIPSSIHEWIIFPASMIGGQEILRFTEIIHEVNETVVNTEEWLGTQPYRFVAETRKVVPVAA